MAVGNLMGCVMTKPIDEMNKDELKTYAKDVFDIELDMRKSIDNLQSEVKSLKKKDPVKVVIADVKKPTHLKNPDTGLYFPWTQLLEERGDLVPCDENGKC